MAKVTFSGVHLLLFSLRVSKESIMFSIKAAAHGVGGMPNAFFKNLVFCALESKLVLFLLSGRETAKGIRIILVSPFTVTSVYAETCVILVYILSIYKIDFKSPFFQKRQL